MKSIRQSYTIQAPVEKVWQALTDPLEIDGWGAGPAKMDGKVGTSFELWGGDIHGKNTGIIKNENLVQDWFGGNWSEASKVSISLKTDGDKTIVDLVHKNIPDDEAEDIDDGWNRYYFGEIKKYLEK